MGVNEDNGKRDMKDGPTKKPFIYYYFLVILIVMILNALVFPMMEHTVEVPDSEFITQLDAGNVKDVYMSSDETQIQFSTKDQQWNVASYKTGPLPGDNLAQRLETAKDEGKVDNYSREIPTKASPLLSFLMSWVAPILMFVIIGQIMGRMLSKRMGGSNAMTFGKSNAKIYAENETGITFADVAGEEEAKDALKEIVDFLHNPQKYADIGANLPKGALLVGPPGTGKTLLARAVAGEAHVPFFSISGSEFVEMFVGMGAAKVRDLFKQANDKAPCIVFIDEIDTIGKKRDGGGMSGNDEREQTLNQLLTEMDGFDGKKGVVILAATNRPESLDKALLRPGRFDRRVPVELPDLKGREAILRVHGRNVKMSDDVDYSAIARATAGASGAELANIINEAALRAVRMGRKTVSQQDLEESVETVIAGYQKKDAGVSGDEKKIVSYHEVGHALVSALQKNTEPVQKITIVPRTMGALGYTLQTPEEEKYLETKDELLAKITTFMAGRAAEVLVFHSATSGAANDIENATKIARAMVTMYGMSDTFGMMCLATVENQYLDGRAGLICGEDTAGQIDKEVLSIINKSYEDAMQMLTENRDILDHISDYLYEKETITGKEFMKIFREMKGLPQEEDKESLMPDDTADEKKESQEPRVLSKENNEAKDDTSIAEDSQSKAAIVSDDMFEE